MISGAGEQGFNSGFTLTWTRWFLVAGLTLQLFFVTLISGREIFWVLSRSQTFFPARFQDDWRAAERGSSVLLLESLPASNPVRQGVAAYLHLAGIDSGYGFFAPNVSDCCKLGFELHYGDGRVEYSPPSVSSHAAGLRLATFLDKVGRPEYDPVREEIIKLLAISMWREHTDAKTIRAVFGLVVLPTVTEFENGIGEHNEFLYAYDFGFSGSDVAPER